MAAAAEDKRYVVTVYVGSLSEHFEALTVEVSKHTTAEEIVSCIAAKLGFPNAPEFELAEVIGNSFGQECKERRIGAYESPVALKLLWPKVVPEQGGGGGAQQGGVDGATSSGSSTSSRTSNVSLSSSGGGGGPVVDYYRFCLREKLTDSLWNESFVKDTQFIRDYFYRFHFQPKDKEYPDLCQLPDLNEGTLLESLRTRFNAGHIYTYVGSILIAVNPFKFHPIYNPKYVKLYQNRRREELPPHIFAIADSAYHTMLKERRNQCIVISGESGSGKTESTNFLLHHLTALSQKGMHGSGVEQTILSAGPVLEAFGNAKTAHNNNSSRFGKFIQVSYKENGMVHGSIVQKFLLEKSRICCQAINERNYHVFYYLLSGASDTERALFGLLPSQNYYYLSQSGCYTLDGLDESYEFSRLKQSMEMVGFGVDKQAKLFSVLSAVLLLGNVKFLPKKSSYRDESVVVENVEVVGQISALLRVTEETLLASLTSKRARVSGEMLVINYRMVEAVAARDAMAKCLYGALFDWIVLQLNHALLSKKSSSVGDFKGKSIGVLDIFGFEDFESAANSFEQFCINYANEHLQYYFNQHVFKYEQEEYKREGIKWTNIEFLDNSLCLSLVESKPSGLICILDDQCNFPGATSETLLQKFNSVHKEHKFYEVPQKREAAFIICHYAGKVKYQVSEFREKNMDLMRHDIVSVLKNSSCTFVRELVGVDPVAVFRWAIVRAFFRVVSAFKDAGKRRREHKENGYRHLPLDRKSSVAREPVVVAKKRSFRSQLVNSRNMKNLRSVRTLANHLAAIGVTNKQMINPRKQPISVSQQFQQSLHSLMVTLNQANPFFIRCIKSNAEKTPNEFDDAIVQRQLKYTGMLETVRIRQAGYNVRLSFDEFVHLYRILLPKGLKSERKDVESFLHSINLNPSNYQLGEQKVFLRETEKIKLDYFLHQQILKSIICIQRWYRSILERRHFLRVQQAVVSIQSYVRMYLVQKNMRMMHLAATYIQKTWRGFRVRKWYNNLKTNCVQFQAKVRGNIVREDCAKLLEEKRKQKREKEAVLQQQLAREVTPPPVPVAFADNADMVRPPPRKRSSEIDGSHQNSRKTPDTVEERLKMIGIPDGSLLTSYEDVVTNYKYYEAELASGKWEGADDNANIRESPRETPKPSSSSKNPLQRAKKQIKTIITPGGTLRMAKDKSELLASESGSNDFEAERVANNGPPTAVRHRRDHAKLGSPPGLSPGVTGGANLSNVSDVPEKEPVRPTRSLQVSDRPFKRELAQTYSLSPVQLDKEPTPPTYDASRRLSTDRVDRRRGYVFAESAPSSGMDLEYPGSRRESAASGGSSSSHDFTIRRSSREADQSYSRNLSISSQDSSLSMHRLQSSAEPRKQSIGATKSVPLRYPGDTDTSSNSVLSMETSFTIGLGTNRRKSKDLPHPNEVASTDGFVHAVHPDLRRARSVSISKDTLKKEKSPPLNDDSRSSKLKKIGYHVLQTVTKYHRGDSCAACKKSVNSGAAGQRCSECRMYFHDKCVATGAISSVTCQQQQPKNHFLKLTTSKSETLGKKLKRKESKHGTDLSKSKFSLTGTSEFTDATDQIISDVNELQAMQEFIGGKISQVKEDSYGKKMSAVDNVFALALNEFKESLVSTFSVASKQGGIIQLSITYKDLIAYFARIMETVCKQEGIGSDFPTNMGVNALRGFLNEFMSSHRTRVEEKPTLAKTRKKLKRGKRQKTDGAIIHRGHSFVSMVVYIPTACEFCSSFIMWPIERGTVCQKCKLACHKKCYPKLQQDCLEGQASGGQGAGKGVFGVPLASLVVGGPSVPVIIEKLIYEIETNGIKQEGIYRKSGVSSKVKELKNEINEGKEIRWDAYTIHVYTSVLKSFFRDMPEPLLTFELYDEFLRAADLSIPEGRVHTIFSLLQKLPNPNYDLMERLIFHLTRVANFEDCNRMNASSLAIVFAPCVLRTDKTRQVLDSLNDVSKQTVCIETIISEQLKKYRSTQNQIEKVDTEQRLFFVRLNSLRKSKLSTKPGGVQTPPTIKELDRENPINMSVEEEEEYINRHINHLRNAKYMLTTALPSLSRAQSEEELLSTDPEMESAPGSTDDLRSEPCSSAAAGSFRRKNSASEVCHECLSPQCHGASSSTLTSHHAFRSKNRGPMRKPPSRFVRNQFHAVDFGEDDFDDSYELDSDLLENQGSDDDDEENEMLV